MSQSTVNERLKILVDKLGMSVSAFSKSIGVPVTTTQNYVKRGTVPKSDYLVKITKHFEYVNSNWLLLGEGEPFLDNKLEPNLRQTGNFNQSRNNNAQTTRGNKDNNDSNSPEAGNQNRRKPHLFISHAHQDMVYPEVLIRQLRSQLSDKDAVIAAKDETITLLRENNHQAKHSSHISTYLIRVELTGATDEDYELLSTLMLGKYKQTSEWLNGTEYPLPKGVFMAKSREDISLKTVHKHVHSIAAQTGKQATIFVTTMDAVTLSIE